MIFALKRKIGEKIFFEKSFIIVLTELSQTFLKSESLYFRNFDVVSCLLLKFPQTCWIMKSYYFFHTPQNNGKRLFLALFACEEKSVFSASGNRIIPVMQLLTETQ